MPNTVYAYIKSIWLFNKYSYMVRDPFLTIQFNVNHFFALTLNFKRFYLTQALQLRVRLDLQAMATKGYSDSQISNAVASPSDS